MEPLVDPPGVMLCTWCDGNRLVAVGSIISPGGEIRSMIAWAGNELEVGCPHCDGTGDEPDPMDDPRIP